jgi:hypothetical protein
MQNEKKIKKPKDSEEYYVISNMKEKVSKNKK